VAKVLNLATLRRRNRLPVRPIEIGRTESSCLTMILSENRFPLFAALTIGSGSRSKGSGP
jgi:hypothetical protein